MVLYFLLAILGVVCELAKRHEQRISRTYPLRASELVKVNFSYKLSSGQWVTLSTVLNQRGRPGKEDLIWRARSKI